MKIIVLRAKDQGKEIVEELSKLGLPVVHTPAIEIVPLSVNISEDFLNRFTTLVFTSVNSVKFFPLPVAQKVLAVGPRTQKCLSKRGQASLIPLNYSSIHLAEFVDKEDKVLIPMAERGREELLHELARKGVPYTVLKMYKTHLKMMAPADAGDLVLFTSPSTVEAFYQTPQPDVTAFCIGGQTAKEACKHTQNIIVSKQATASSLVASVKSYIEELYACI